MSKFRECLRDQREKEREGERGWGERERGGAKVLKAIIYYACDKALNASLSHPILSILYRLLPFPQQLQNLLVVVFPTKGYGSESR